MARDVYESIRAWTCRIGRVDKLYAFSYLPQQPERDINTWTVYDAEQEFTRQGALGGRDRGWRKTMLNSDYSVGSITFSWSE